MTLHHVKPLLHYAHLTPFILVGYSGYGSPIAFLANPEDVWFITDRHHPPSASLWMVPGTPGETET
jgi:hypothetical protein